MPEKQALIQSVRACFEPMAASQLSGHALEQGRRNHPSTRSADSGYEGRVVEQGVG
jgi:hypothetical protein